jgi:signal transduction histidine kinase
VRDEAFDERRRIVRRRALPASKCLLLLAALCSAPLAVAQSAAAPVRHVLILHSLAGVLIFVVLFALWLEWRRRHRIELENTRQRGELTHATRLATIGELAASIVHEINQPLGAILNNADAAEMLLEQTPSDLTQVRQIIADIRRDDLRASEVIRHMRALLRKRELTLAPVDVNDSVSAVAKLLQDEAHRREVKIDNQLAAELPPVAADRVHVEQVLLNLLINAMDAMETTPPGRRLVQVQTRAVRGGWVEVAISDSGIGLAPQARTQLFDSFYSTKKNGLGLGLSIARSIIETHGGRIWAENNRDAGATFRFTLSATPAAGEILGIEPRPAAAKAAV